MRTAQAICVALGLTAIGAAEDPPATLPPATAPAEVKPPPATTPPVTVPQPPPVLIPPPPERPPGEAPQLYCVPTGPRPGLFGGIDFSLIVPHVANDLRGTVFVPPIFRDEVRLPGADVDGTLAPKLMLGYRFANGCGGITLNYRNISSEGQELVTGLDPLGESTLYSRVDVNEFGINYTTCEYPLGAYWGIRWEVGARLTSIFFDSQSSGLFIGQHASNHFFGAGPQVALDATCEIPGTGYALFCRADFADLLGRIQQRFGERVGDASAPIGVGSFEQDGNQAVPYLGLQLGVSWLSRTSGRYRITAGYQFDQYWNAGKLGDSRGDVQSNGLFFRSEFNF